MEKLENVKSDRQQQKSPLSFIKKLLIVCWRFLLTYLMVKSRFFCDHCRQKSSTGAESDKKNHFLCSIILSLHPLSFKCKESIKNYLRLVIQISKQRKIKFEYPRIFFISLDRVI